MTEKDAYIAFNLVDQIGSVRLGELIRVYGSAVAAWEQYPDKAARSGGEADWEGECRQARKFGVTILTPLDDGYPEMLRKSPGHPLALYVKGNVEALSMPGIAIIGTRRATPYGIDQAHKFGYDIAAAGWSVVSGLALGIDAEAHRGALEAKGVTVGVLGSALDRFYPENNRELAREIVKNGGAVISEFPFGRDPDQQTFPQRNHVVAGLASGVLAVEAPVKSGTLITTSIAADLGRIVMAVPGRVDSRSSAGCLWLIRNGARLVRGIRDVDEEMSDLFKSGATVPSKAKGAAVPSNAKSVAVEEEKKPRQTAAPQPKYSVEEAMVMKFVDAEGISIDELVRKTKLPVAKVNAVTMTLRMKGRLRYFPGNRVALPRAN